jgi:HPt (histidine-containing phosphotransfer) domain-containing protein
MAHKQTDQDSPPMDYQSALERVGMDTEFLAELIALFQSEFTNFCRRVQEALDSGDYHTVSMLAHSLKGSSANLGFPGLGNISRELETAGASQDHLSIEKNLAVLLMEYQRVKTYLRNINVCLTTGLPG